MRLGSASEAILELFHSLTSPYSRKVRVFLFEKGTPFEEINVRESTRRPTEKNPLGKVPTLVTDDGSALFDSVVIVEAMEARFPEPKLLGYSDAERAGIRCLEAVADGLSDVLIPIVTEEQRPANLRNDALVTKLSAKVVATLCYLDARAAAGKYLVASGYSLADIAVCAALGYVRLRRPDFLPPHERLLGYETWLLERHVHLARTVPPNLPPAV